MITPQEVAEYNIKKFREVVSGTNYLILVFVFTLTYVWFQSIEPNANTFRSFEETKSRSFAFTQERIDSFQRSSDNHMALFKITRNIEDSNFSLAEDVISINLSEERKKYLTLLDSIKGKKLKIDIPTLSAVELPLRLGLIVWFFLSLFLIFLIYRRRKLAIKYLTKGFYYYKDKIAANNYNLKSLDIEIPFWMGPVKIEGTGYQKKVLYSITAWSFKNKIFLTILVGVLVFLLLRVWWINLNMNNNESFGKSAMLVALGNLMLLTPIIIIIKWIQFPVKIRTR